jgi:hypothetical protein
VPSSVTLGRTFFVDVQLFEGGIFDTKCKKIIGLPELRQMIEIYPNAEKITRIRDLRKKGDEYKSVKEELLT